MNGTAAASRFFTSKLGKKVSENTIVSIKKAYRVEKRKCKDDEDVKLLPYNKRGRPCLLGKTLDDRVQEYLKKVREGGGVITSRIVMAAAKGIICHDDRLKLVEYGGHISLNRHWAYSLLTRMKFVQRKATTAKSKHSVENFASVKRIFLDDLVDTVTMEEIPPELILNWDQTGIHMVPSSCWTMDRQGVKRVEVAGVNDKRQITAVLCGSLTGDFLPIQLIYKGKTPRCHPHYNFPIG